ncbi:hypothetical protein P7D22_19975, partial [Lichenihabitans sp. Uapishka_5]|nr:hypothetical protein [Lichenihabitans sp. Uapishka_5]
PGPDPLLGAIAGLLNGATTPPPPAVPRSPAPPLSPPAEPQIQAHQAQPRPADDDDGLPPASIPLHGSGTTRREGRSILDKLFDGG